MLMLCLKIFFFYDFYDFIPFCFWIQSTFSYQIYSAWNIQLSFKFDVLLFKGKGSSVRVLRI